MCDNCNSSTNSARVGPSYSVSNWLCSKCLEDILPFNQLDDVSYNLAIFEMANGSVHFDSDRLECLYFNPIQAVNNAVGSNDLDPDSNFTTAPSTCIYYSEEQLNDLVSKKVSNIEFSVLHVNARSLLGNFDKFRQLLSLIDNSFSVIGVSETWLNEISADMVNLPGYKFISMNRTFKSGGGVGLYLHEKFEFQIRTDCCLSNHSSFESVFVEIKIPHGKNIIVGTIYRPPSQNVHEFIESYQRLLAIVGKENKVCYIMGDFNLDFLKYEQHSATSEFIDLMYAHMLYPLITRPTRLTSNTATLIDNIFTNNISSHSDNGLIINDLSDHLPIFSLAYSNNTSVETNENFVIRDFNSNNVNKFNALLSGFDWNFISKSTANSAYTLFINKYAEFYNISFPAKTIKGKRLKSFRNPWLSKGLLKAINKKGRLYKQFLRSPNAERETKYKSYKNKLNHLLRIAKKNYYEQKLENSKSDLKTTWKILNEVINKRKPKPAYPSCFKSNGKAISDPLEIANGFCDYFTNIGPSLAEKIQPTSSSHIDFLSGVYPNSIMFKEVTHTELQDIVAKSKLNKAPGYDNISMKIVSLSLDNILQPLTEIINLSLNTGLFPDALKLAKVIPIFKADDPEYFNNYRPISILPVFSKLFERVVYNRVYEFLTEHSILNNDQFGFRRNHSTSLALIQLINSVASSIDNNKLTAGIFLDLSKAFDTINHKILCDKLEHYGIRGVALDWIVSYLSNRQQFVQFGSHCSYKKGIQCGVPQGSILGPLFFILYMNDLSCVSNIIKCLLFADDTSIFYSHEDSNQLIHVLNCETKKIMNWLKANMLSLNIDKTNYMIFRSRQKQFNSTLSITMDNVFIKQVEVTKFLGVFIDQNLTWKPHISFVAKKMSKSIGIICKSRFFLSSKSMLSLYYTLVYPYLNYCNTVWSSTYQTNLNRIYLLQKRIVRVISKAEYLAHTVPLFKELKILDIYSVTSLMIANFMYSFHNQLLPDCFQNLFITNQQIHNYNTRHASNYRSHECRTNIKQFTVLYQGPKIWNSLPYDLINSSNIATFKRSFKTYLVEQRVEN